MTGAMGPGGHVYLNLPYVADAAERIKSSVDALCIVGLPWEIVGATAFRIPEHINILEARALLSYVQLCVRERRSGQRLIVVVDSGVVKGAVRKFRSSSRGLNFVLRQLGALCLAYDLYLELLWVPTWANPGDAPSRGASLAEWRRKADAIEKISFGSLLDEVRYHDCAVAALHLCREWAKEPQPVLAIRIGPGPADRRALTHTATKPEYVKQPIHKSARNETWELCCGSAVLGTTLGQAGFKSFGADLADSRFQASVGNNTSVYIFNWDLLQPKVIRDLCQRLERNRTVYVHIGMDCSSFSVLRIRSRTTSRSKLHPWGNASFPGESEGNILITNMLKIFWTLENPDSSRLWDLPPIKRLFKKRNVEIAILDMCQFGLKDPVSQDFYKKRTKFVGTLPGLATMSRTCNGEHKHQHVEDSIMLSGKSTKRSIVAGIYPRQFCEEVTRLLSLAQSSAHTARCCRVGLRSH
jgi:hypothetical protein